MAEGFPCSVAGLMAVPLSLVSHETRAYAQAPLATTALNGNDRQQPKLQRYLSNAFHLGKCTRQAELQAEALHPEIRRTNTYLCGLFGPCFDLMGFQETNTGIDAKRGHEGIEPSTSPTLKENHTTRPMARALVAARSTAINATGINRNKMVFLQLLHRLQSSVGRAVGC